MIPIKNIYYMLCYAFQIDPNMGEYTFSEIVRQVSLYLRFINNEKEIQAMTIDEMLLLPGISVAEIGMINELQKAIKANKVISYLGGEEKNG